jgi:hypothetical protein
MPGLIGEVDKRYHARSNRSKVSLRGALVRTGSARIDQRAPSPGEFEKIVETAEPQPRIVPQGKTGLGDPIGRLWVRTHQR